MNRIRSTPTLVASLLCLLFPVIAMATTSLRPSYTNDVLGGISPRAFDNTNAVAMLDDAPEPPPTPPAAPTPAPPSVGQQPFPINNERDETPSLSNSNQLVQLFQLEATPDTLAAGEAYATFNFNFVKFPGSNKQFRYQLDGEYGITDQIAAGVFVPLIQSKDDGVTHFGFGDVGIYGKYKFDRIIDPEVIDVTAQVDFILPTGSNTRLQDTGKFGVRPLLLAYKDFGMHGPGDFGMYALLGCTITTNSDFRAGLAATYQYDDLVGILEFYDQAGDKQGAPLVQFTPGIAYRGLGNWVFAIGAPIGINNGTPDWAINFKVSYLFAK